MARVFLTASFVKTVICPTDRKKQDYFDKNQTGFLVEVRRSGGKTFYQRYTDTRGDEHQFKIGPAKVLSLSAARKKGRQIIAQALLGADPQDERIKRRSIPTFSELVQSRYLPYARNYKRSWRTDQTLLRVHILPVLATLYVDQITSEPITALVQQMHVRGYATGTTNRVVVLLRHIFNLGSRWRIAGIGENPTAGIALAPDVHRERFLTREEAQRLKISIEADQNKPAAKAIMLLLLTGARRNEITHAKWQHLDWNKRMLVVPLSKSGKPRAIALSGEAIDVLHSVVQSEENPYIFPSPATKRPSPSLFFPWHRIRVRAGLSDLRLHDLRHSFASCLVNQDIPLYTVKALLGHGNIRYTERYAHLMPATLLDATEVVSRTYAAKLRST